MRFDVCRLAPPGLMRLVHAGESGGARLMCCLLRGCLQGAACMCQSAA